MSAAVPGVSRDGRSRGRWVKPTVLVAALALLFLLGEAAARIRVRHVVRTKASVYRILEPLPGDPRSYRLRPGADVAGYRIDPDGFRWHGVGSSTGAAARILVMGDSISFGMGVKDSSDTFPALLERQLASFGRVRVVNAGVPGYSSMQEYHHLVAVSARVRPSLVILGYCLNDADPVELEEEVGVLWRSPARLGRSDWSLRSVVNQSFLLRSIKARLLELSPGLRVRAVNARVREAAWAESRQHVARMHDALAEQGIPFLVVVFPWRVQLECPGTRLVPQEDLAAFFSRVGIDFVDLSAAFGENTKLGLFLPDGIHPTEAGHRVAAERIGAALRERGLIERLGIGPTVGNGARTE